MPQDTTAFKRPLKPADLVRMCLPEEFWRVRIHSVTTEGDVQSIVWNYMVRLDHMFDKGAGLILSGKTGVGKTGIAALIMKEARSRGYPGYYLTVAQLRDGLQTSAQFDYEMTMLERIRTVELLVLDDFSIADTTKFSLDLRRLAEIIATRGNQHLITIITTQIPRSDFKKNDDLRPFYETIHDHMVLLGVVGPDLKKKNSENLQALVTKPSQPQAVPPVPEPKKDPDKGTP